MNSLPGAPEIVELRRRLREQFPAAHLPASPVAAPALPLPPPAALRGLEDIARGTITEVVSPRPGAGNGLLIQGLIHGAALRKRHIALIDGRDAFDPQSAGLESFGRLLWARCRDAAQALAAADLLLRDGNLELVAMDLQLNPLRELGRLPSSSWHRLRGLAEKSGAALIALTPQRIIPSAHLRVELDGSFALDAFDLPREELRGRLLLRVLRRRFTPAMSFAAEKRKAG